VWQPLWSSGQNSWLQIQRFGFDSRRYQIFWEVVDLERGPLSPVSTTEELLERKNSGSGLEDREYGRGDPLRWSCDTLYPQKLALTSPTSGGRSVGIVSSRTKATEFSFFFSGGVNWVPLVWRPLCGLLYQPRMIDNDEVSGMRIGRGNRTTQKNYTLVPLCPPQIPYDLTWARTRAAVVWGWRLTAWAVTRPFISSFIPGLSPFKTSFSTWHKAEILASSSDDGV
jgi:hypothetical protein